MSHERVDEAIDRVARALTAVPADPGFSTRLSVRLERRSWNLTPWLLAASAAGVLIVATLVMFRPATGEPELVAGRSGEPATSRERPAAARRDAPAPFAPAPPAPLAPAPVAPAPPAPLAPVPPLAPSTAPAAPAAPAAPVPPVPPVPPADTASGPAALQVAILTVEPLTIAEVSVSPLDVASLEIADVDGGGESKEPK